MPIINIIKGGWNNIIKIIFAIYSLSEYSKSLLKLQMNVLHAKKVGEGWRKAVGVANAV